MATKYGGLDDSLVAEIKATVFAPEGFMRFTQVMRRGGGSERVSCRPVALKEGVQWQFEQGDGRDIKVSNLAEAEARAAVAELLEYQGPCDLHVQTATADLHVRVTRKGRALVSRSKPLERPSTAALPHDRQKQQPLNAFDATALLRGLGIMGVDGQVKASMRGKYDQINAFLRILEVTLDDKTPASFDVVDYGCGKAYLTFAALFYLDQVKGYPVRVCGIDHNSGVVAGARRLAESLGVADKAQFVEGEIATAVTGLRPTLALSLHAYDTATDAALAAAVEAKSRYILCAPCCQHELNKDLSGGGAMRAVLRHGILRERLADILTDTFRAQLLRIAGYRVRVVEFVDHEATAKNIMLRAEAGIAPRQAEAVAEYLALRELWGVTPWLEKRLGSEKLFS